MQYFQSTGQPQKRKVVSRYLGYHGTSMGALSITGVPGLRNTFEPLVPGSVQGGQCERVPLLDVRDGRQLQPGVRERHRAGHPARRTRDGGRGVRRARPELGRLLRPRRRLHAAGPRDLRPVRRAHGVRRGDLRVRAPRAHVRLRPLRLRPRHHHLRQGAHLRLLAARGDDRERPPGRAVHQLDQSVPARVHLRRSPGELRRGDGQPRRLRERRHPAARPRQRARVPPPTRNPRATFPSSATSAGRATSTASRW